MSIQAITLAFMCSRAAQKFSSVPTREEIAKLAATIHMSSNTAMVFMTTWDKQIEVWTERGYSEERIMRDPQVASIFFADMCTILTQHAILMMVIDGTPIQQAAAVTASMTPMIHACAQLIEMCSGDWAQITSELKICADDLPGSLSQYGFDRPH